MGLLVAPHHDHMHHHPKAAVLMTTLVVASTRHGSTREIAERVAEVLDAIRDAAERGRTVLVASHDMRVAEASDKVVDL